MKEAQLHNDRLLHIAQITKTAINKPIAGLALTRIKLNVKKTRRCYNSSSSPESVVEIKKK